MSVINKNTYPPRPLPTWKGELNRLSRMNPGFFNAWILFPYLFVLVPWREGARGWVK